jgi:hypothetical protein
MDNSKKENGGEGRRNGSRKKGVRGPIEYNPAGRPLSCRTREGFERDEVAIVETNPRSIHCSYLKPSRRPSRNGETRSIEEPLIPGI